MPSCLPSVLIGCPSIYRRFFSVHCVWCIHLDSFVNNIQKICTIICIVSATGFTIIGFIQGVWIVDHYEGYPFVHWRTFYPFLITIGSLSGIFLFKDKGSVFDWVRIIAWILLVAIVVYFLRFLRF